MPHGKWHMPASFGQTENEGLEFLETEEKMSCFVRAPVPEILNEVCFPLDCEIGSVILSLFSDA